MQVFTVVVDAVMFFAGCGIRIAAQVLTFCAWVGLVTAVLYFVLTLINTLGEDLIAPPHNALEECIPLLPPYDC